MKYPDDFNTPAFPAGKFVAVSRFMATAVMLLFFAIICLCGIILWIKGTQTTSPFLVSVRPDGERWTLVEHANHTNQIPAYYVMQESLLNKFVHDWFTISDNILTNQAIWSNGCTRTSPECQPTNTDNAGTCAIYCVTSDAVFDSFQKVVLPTYSTLEAESNATWTVRDVRITPIGNIQEHEGLWHLNIVVQTSNMGKLRLGAFALIKQNANIYLNNFGYYVDEFNSYRMN